MNVPGRTYVLLDLVDGLGGLDVLGGVVARALSSLYDETKETNE